MKKDRKAAGILLIVLAVASRGDATQAQAPRASYPKMAPLEQYLIAHPADEIALARTAAPPSISADATVLVLGRHGYETAVKGKNEFVCFVERSWTAGFDDWQFWNPKLRAPNCFNAPAVRTELPVILKRTEWVLAGVPKSQMIEKTKAAIASGEFKPPEPGAFSFMLSKQGYVSDDAEGPWLPHIMFFLPHGQAAVWAADEDGSPILGKDNSAIETTVLFVPVRSWSDGSPAPPPAQKHVM